MKKMELELSTLLSKPLTLSKENIVLSIKVRDALFVQKAVLNAMIFSGENIGSRGSCLYEDSNIKENHTEKIVTQILPEMHTYFQKCNNIPVRNMSFETVWKQNK